MAAGDVGAHATSQGSHLNPPSLPGGGVWGLAPESDPAAERRVGVWVNNWLYPR